VAQLGLLSTRFLYCGPKEDKLDGHSAMWKTSYSTMSHIFANLF